MTPSYTLTWIFPDGVERKTDGYRPLNLLGHAEIAGIPLRQACGGQAECGTCRVRIVSGTFTEPGGSETELMNRHRRRFDPSERLACQARPRSDARIALVKVRVKDLRALDEAAD